MLKRALLQGLIACSLILPIASMALAAPTNPSASASDLKLGYGHSPETYPVNQVYPYDAYLSVVRVLENRPLRSGETLADLPSKTYAQAIFYNQDHRQLNAISGKIFLNGIELTYHPQRKHYRTLQPVSVGLEPGNLQWKIVGGELQEPVFALNQTVQFQFPEFFYIRDTQTEFYFNPPGELSVNAQRHLPRTAESGLLPMTDTVQLFMAPPRPAGKEGYGYYAHIYRAPQVTAIQDNYSTPIPNDSLTYDANKGMVTTGEARSYVRSSKLYPQEIRLADGSTQRWLFITIVESSHGFQYR